MEIGQFLSELYETKTRWCILCLGVYLCFSNLDRFAATPPGGVENVLTILVPYTNVSTMRMELNSREINGQI